MSVLSNIASAVKNTRLVPPTESSLASSKAKDENTQQLSTPQRPILQITSYNRFTPPTPKPDLEYDCRITQNPSRQSRQTCTGVDASLQEELMQRNSFVDLLSQAEDEIKRMMEVKDARAKGEGETVILRVGCLCGSGHHRSVAFAEQLGKIKWLEEWEVRVQHRDLTEGVEDMKRGRSDEMKR
ncbi:hypothetical protein EJ02DRAFT_458052 [Clathrospora elynae]|uniref:RapZ C-terminal domain-containing protein n=1 Tax=Clathrospora elynae TaxID=706981 RepID=A0A6A5SED2_9PLEO|nr:hypothetical protein EJ02DRAFT_458052 [Clathrospora elynae]